MFFTEQWELNEKFRELLKQVQGKQSPVAISGLVDVEKMHILTSIFEKTKQPICILTVPSL